MKKWLARKYPTKKWTAPMDLVLSRESLIRGIEWKLVLVATLLLLSLPADVFVHSSNIKEVFLNIQPSAGGPGPAERVSLSNRLQGVREQGFWQLDLHSLQAKIESLDWIYRADLKKHWPNRLELHILVEEPAYIWNNNGYLNADGEEINSLKSVSGLPRIHAPEGLSQEAMAHFHRLHRAFGGVDILWLDLRGNLRVLLKTGTLIDLGTTDLDSRIVRAQSIIRNMASEASDLATLDLRYSNGAAFTRHNRITKISPQIGSSM